MNKQSDCKLPLNPRYQLHALSWSDMVAIEADVAKWLKGTKLSNRSMTYGTHVHKLIEKGHLTVPRLGNPEQIYRANIPIKPSSRKTFTVVGRIDDSNDTTILDYKTGMKLWTRKQVEEHGQLKGYAFLRWKATGKMPTKGVIVSLKTEPHDDSDSMVLTGEMSVIEVPITRMDLLKIQVRFRQAYWKVIDFLKEN